MDPKCHGARKDEGRDQRLDHVRHEVMKNSDFVYLERYRSGFSYYMYWTIR